MAFENEFNKFKYQMIKESDGDNYEEMHALEQNLTFESAKVAFARYGVEFGEEKYRTLGIKQKEMYSNLGLLISDQCPYTTKIAVFNDEELTTFRDSKEFGGSIFKQFEDAVNYLALCNKTISNIEGFVRYDKKDYPDEAIRESLLNALIHRDYSFSGSIIINVNDTKMEFISLGGLLPGLTIEDIRLGISQPRNKKLAEIFHRLHLIESYGTGIRRVYKLYENCIYKPKIEVTQNAFKIILPNMNTTIASIDDKSDFVTDQMKIVLSYLEKHEYITDVELENLLKIKKTRAFNLTKKMKELELIESIGRGTKKRYVIQKK